MALSLYHNDVAVCAQKVRLVLAEKNLAYTGHLLDLRAGDSHTREYLKLNPKGVVPTLVDGEDVITESTIINEYLDQKYPNIKLQFSLARSNSKMRFWVMKTDTGLLRTCGRVSFGIAFRHQEQSAQLASRSAEERAAQERRNKLGLEHEEASAALVEYDRLLSEIEKTLQTQPWLAGEKYSLAECAIIPYIRRLEDLSLSWLWEEDATRLNLSNWYERCKKRSSFYEAIEKHLPENKKALMQETGKNARRQVEKILARHG